MIKLTDFYDYLKKNLPNSADHYESGIRAVSKDMLKEGVIKKPIEEMTSPELEIAVFNIFNNTFFIEKNTRGRRMYSNAIKQFQSYKKSTSKDNDYLIIENSIKKDCSLNETERLQIVKARKGQGIFRDKLITKYSRCIISGIYDERVLIASHIKPWTVSSNFERIDVENGLLLNSLYDRMFDIGLITFENSGKLRISSSVNNSDIEKLILKNETYYDLKPTSQLKLNLEYHRDVIFIP